MGSCLVDVRKALQELREKESVRLFNRSSTVKTATQSQRSWEKRQGASDEAIVVRRPAERQEERRASVIQS